MGGTAAAQAGARTVAGGHTPWTSWALCLGVISNIPLPSLGHQLRIPERLASNLPSASTEAGVRSPMHYSTFVSMAGFNYVECRSPQRYSLLLSDALLPLGFHGLKRLKGGLHYKLDGTVFIQRSLSVHWCSLVARVDKEREPENRWRRLVT